MEDIKNNILNVLKRQLGERWDRLSREAVSLAEQCAADAAALQVEILATDPEDVEGQARNLREKAQIDAQLGNFAALGAAEVQSAFWQAVGSVASMLIPILLAAV